MAGTPAKPDLTFDDDQLYDQSSRAEAVLDVVLRGEDKVVPVGPEPEPELDPDQVTVDEALKARPVIDVDTGRTKSRVLFVTTDEYVLEPNSATQQTYLDLASLFDEVHVMVLLGRRGKDAHERLADNVWFYQVHNKYWWRLPWAAIYAAFDALTFNENIRPDVIVGINPFEAGLAAYFIARDFGRPVQIHINKDFLHPSFTTKQKANKWRKWMAHYVLRQVSSVRTHTDTLREILTKKFSRLVDIRTLPRLYNFSQLQKAKPAYDVHERYKDFVFIIITFGPLTADSHLHDAFTALRQTLLNKRIGLLVIGDGPAKSLFVEKTKLLGIEESVVFLAQLDDEVSVYKTANVLIETSTHGDSEIHVLKAAAAGLPIIAYETDTRQDLFKDGESALLCEPGDMTALSQQMTKLLNSQATRIELARNSEAMAAERLVEDSESYQRAFRDTIEIILTPPESKGEETAEKETESPTKETAEPANQTSHEETTDTDPESKSE